MQDAGHTGQIWSTDMRLAAGMIPMAERTRLHRAYVRALCTQQNGYIRASVDALCRDGTSEISRDPRTKRLQTRRESLAMPSKHTNNNF